MNTELFTQNRTGQLLPIKVNEQDDFAFIPFPLPPKEWVFPATLWPLLTKARALLGKLDGIGRTLPDPQLLLSPLRRREAITSSALEGTYATPQELMLFELSPTKSSPADRTNEWREVSNYHRALQEGSRMLTETPFCLRLFKALHSTLLSGVRTHYTSAGEFRQHQVAIGSDRRYIPPPPSHLDECLNGLEIYINSEHAELDPLVKAYIAHYQFEAIHPFYDGNGRIGRVLLSLMISNWCGFECPWLYMSAFFERFKDEYITNMFKVSTEGAWEKWIEFCLRGTISQAEDSIRRCDELRKLRSSMLERIKPYASVRTHGILESLFSNPIVRISSLSRELKVTYPTAKDDVERLVRANILHPLVDIRPRAYFSPEIFGVAYDPEHLS